MGKRSCFDDLLFTALPSEDVLKALKEIILLKKIDWNPSNVLLKHMRLITFITLHLIFVGYSGFLNAEEIANSINDFSFDGTQGENDWVSGYRNYSQDGGGDDYDPNQDFIAFDQNEHWRGEGWRLVPTNAPWTTLNSEFGHPNGPNNGDEHWAIRRWESDRSGPLAFTWSLREQNDGGSGVGGSLHHNGVLVDSESTSDTNGFTRTYYLNICLLYTSPSPRDRTRSRMPSSA